MALTNCLKLVRSLSYAISKHNSILTIKPSVSEINRCSSTSNTGLMEFFDMKKHWGESNIKVGRSWRLEELRIKSNSDLHKLWYVLIKERNMLFTMEHECNDKVKLFPNPERIDKVEESMKNLETVVRERNVAYHELETGEKGERVGKAVYNQLGLKVHYKYSEHVMPKFMNSNWYKTHVHNKFGGYAVSRFLRYYREKLYVEKRKQRNRNQNYVQSLLKRFPNIDMDKLKADYPDVNIEKALRSKKSRGNFEPRF